MSHKIVIADKLWRSRALPALALIICSIPQSDCARPNAVPTLTFTDVPAASHGGPSKLDVLAGTARGATPGQRIVLYAFSGTWWVQPLADSPFTNVQPDASWRASIHLGTQYAALLV